jgi:hypothetical protein
MGQILKPNPVKLIFGFIFKEGSELKKTKTIINELFGKTDFESKNLAFTHSDYYEKEFGTGLLRKFISIKRLVLPSDLPQIKITANKIEEKLAIDKRRTINIDPGYVDLAKLILASTKDYVHRIYLDGGIFAETTLFYRENSFKPQEWTYPDYRTPEYIEIFNEIRKIYFAQLQAEG